MSDAEALGSHMEALIPGPESRPWRDHDRGEQVRIPGVQADTPQRPGIDESHEFVVGDRSEGP